MKPTAHCSVALLREWLAYDPHTGIITWRKGRRKRDIGAVAGMVDKRGHCVIGLQGQRYTASRIAWALQTGEWPTQIVDRRDNDPLNLKWDNLRLATQSQDKANAKRHKNNTSGYRGVTWDEHNQKWRAQYGTPGKRLYLGLYGTKEEAANAYQKAVVERHGHFARFD